jgi:lipoprotein-anchoring transpeptidase ErfK/SrfK
VFRSTHQGLRKNCGRVGHNLGEYPFRTSLAVLSLAGWLAVPSLGLSDNPLAEQSKSAHPDRKEVLALQIALESEGFPPGALDGHAGRKTREAQELLKQTGRKATPPAEPVQEWIVPAKFLSDLAPVPSEWADKAKSRAMAFETPLEKIAEHFHSSRDLLIHLNPETDFALLREGDRITVPKLIQKKPIKADHLKVSLNRKIIFAYDAGGGLLAAFPCSIAAQKEKRPVGLLQVKNVAPNPVYTYDPALFQQDSPPGAVTLPKSKLIIPPGPNNPVGTMWIGLSLPGYGIHGTPEPEDIGKTESRGCFRLSNWDANHLGRMIRIGMPVTVEE